MSRRRSHTYTSVVPLRSRTRRRRCGSILEDDVCEYVVVHFPATPSFSFVRYANFSQGLAQTKFLEFGKQNQNVKTHVVRPAGVLAGDGSALLGCLLRTVSVRALAAVMVDLAVNGGSEQVVTNTVIIERGKELLMKQK